MQCNHRRNCPYNSPTTLQLVHTGLAFVTSTMILPKPPVYADDYAHDSAGYGWFGETT